MSFKPGLKYRYTVGPRCEFRTLQSAILYLTNNMMDNSEIILDGGEHYITDTITINLPHSLCIRGLTWQSTIIKASTGLAGKPMFNVISDTFFERITLDASGLATWGTTSGENMINFTGNASYCEFKDMFLTGSYIGVNITGSNTLFAFNYDIRDTTFAGLNIDASGSTKFDTYIGQFTNNPISIRLKRSNTGDFNINSIVFDNATGQTGSYYDGDNYLYKDGPVIQNCKWNGTGSFQKGIDHSRMDGRDANIVLINNSGYEDKTPHCKINIIDNAATTTVGTAGNYYKANYIATGSNYTCKFTTGSDGRITYQPYNVKDTVIWLAGAVSTNGTNKNVTVGISKNSGSIVGPMTVRCATAGQPYSFSSIVYNADSGQGDFYELHLTSTSNGDLVTVQDLAIYAASR